MKRQLTPVEVIYDFDLWNVDLELSENHIPEYNDVYKNIKTALDIQQEGFNVYLVDSFSRDKIDNIIYYIENIYSSRRKPKDICYVTYEDEKRPEILILNNGVGNSLSSYLQNLQQEYQNVVFKFYNGTSEKEKDNIMEDMQKRRNSTIATLVDSAKKRGFDVKYSNGGFVFIPLRSGDAMSESDYNSLENIVKEEILKNVSELKIEAENILKELREIEDTFIEKIKVIFKRFLMNEMEAYKGEYKKIFNEDSSAIEYLNTITENIEKDIVEMYTSIYDDDEEKINDIIYRYIINVIVDNSENKFPPVIFERDPNISNLIGTIEYENHNGNYITDATLITAGSILKANEGCIIIRVEDLLNNPGAYYYLKKAFLNEQVDFDYNRGYLELLSLNGLKPEPIDISTKLILIGDYATYDILYSYDEDFKKIFKIRAEYNPIVDINYENKQALVSNINYMINKNGLNKISKGATREIAKFLSRKAENKNKIYFDVYDLNRILLLADNISKSHNKIYIEETDILEAAYPKEILEKEVIDSYREGKILINLKDNVVGSINALSVTGTSYYSFGRPIRVTCVCHKGEGNIIDVHKESDLSGNIHRKAINILKAYLNTLCNCYSKLSVDFYLSFEQIYGKLDGDSASVAETICMISAITKIPIRQNIAVTGSINQFGEVQPIGGVNEKIEGFFNICSNIDDIKGKAVIIPESNISDLVLSKEVEGAINEGFFKIYTMKHIKDAIEVLMVSDPLDKDYVLEKLEEEVRNFNKD